jgi:hypothetical protein
MRFIRFVERESAWRQGGRAAGDKELLRSSVVPREVFRISDIVKRKRIRLPDVGRRASEDGFYLSSVVRPLSSDKQPVVGRKA